MVDRAGEREDIEGDIKIMKDLSPLFDPRSIAVIGATNDFNKWGFITFLSTISGFRGKVYPVNWNEEKVLGYPAFKKVTDIPDPIDLAIFVIPAPAVSNVMEDCVEKGVKSAVIISAGFAEIGEEGKRLEDELIRVAKKGKIRFVGPNCMGFWSASSNLSALMYPTPFRDGPFALVTQGGNLGVAIAMDAYKRGIGFHRYVSCGRAVGIQIEDYIEYFGKDPEVKVILTYIEGLDDGRRFIDKVRGVTREKPVVVLKPGKSEVTERAIMSHSGALSGSYQIYGEAFKKAGAIRVDSAEELLDVGIGLLSQPLPTGRNVAVITPGGSYGVMCADCCAPLGLNVIKLPKNIINEFDKMFPPRWSRGNPIDPAGDRDFVPYLKAVERVMELKEVDSLIFMGFGNLSSFFEMDSPLFRDMIKFMPEIVPNLLSTFDLRKIDIQQFLPLLNSPFLSSFLAFSYKGVNGDTDEKELSEKVTSSINSAFEGSGNIRTFKGLIDSVIEKIDLVGLILPLLPIIAPIISAGEEIGEKEFVPLIAPIIESSRSDITSITKNMILGIPSFLNPEGMDMSKILEVFDSIMGMIVLYWIEAYKKPIIATTFSGATTPLINLSRGPYFAYPSPERAAKVLTKLFEYKEYLDSSR